MKATELRIGNLVRNNLNGEILKPCDVLCDGINTDNIEGLNYGFIEPIPLTEEWLLKFGFKWKNFAFRDGTFTVRYQKEFYVYLSVEGVRPIQIKLDYVHQLQNLYFTLTGEELILNA
jgi:hypothetical protein